MRIRTGCSTSNTGDGEVPSSRIIRYASGYAPYVEDQAIIAKSKASMADPTFETPSILDTDFTKVLVFDPTGMVSSALRRKAGVSVITKGPRIHWGTCRSRRG